MNLITTKLSWPANAGHDTRVVWVKLLQNQLECRGLARPGYARYEPAQLL